MSRFDRLTEQAKAALPGYIKARGGLGVPTGEQAAAADAYARKWAESVGDIRHKAYLDAELAKAKTAEFIKGVQS